MSWTAWLLVLGVLLAVGGWAICRVANAIAKREFQLPDSEPRIVPMNRTPWKDPVPTIVINADQQAELMRIYREEYLEVCVWPEMPLMAFLRAVEDHQRSDKPIEVEVMFAQRHALREFSVKHRLDWLRYAVDRSVAKEQTT
jgi:hypothetical protein